MVFQTWLLLLGAITSHAQIVQSEDRVVDIGFNLSQRCEPPEFSYFGSSGCFDTCPEYSDAISPATECLPLLTHHVAIIAHPNVTVSQDATGTVHLNLTLPLLPRKFFEDVNISFAVDIKPGISDLHANSICNFEWRPLYNIVDDVFDNGWTDSTTWFSWAYGRIHGAFQGGWVERRFTFPKDTPARLSVQLIFLGPGLDNSDFIYIKVDGVVRYAAYKFTVCIDGVQSAYDCFVDHSFDIGRSLSGEVTVRIGSGAPGTNQWWGFSNLKLDIPILAVDLAYKQFNESCILGSSQDSYDIIRGGYVGVFVLADTQIVYEHYTSLKILFPRWTTGTSTPVGILSAILLYDSDEFQNVKRLPLYRVGTTIWAEHALDTMVLPMQVTEVFVSTSADPTSYTDVVCNITNFQQHSPELGRARFSFQAVEVCDACTLHVISVVSVSRRLKSHRRTHSEEDQTEVEEHQQDFARTSIPMEWWSVTVTEQLPNLEDKGEEWKSTIDAFSDSASAAFVGAPALLIVGMTAMVSF